MLILKKKKMYLRSLLIRPYQNLNLTVYKFVTSITILYEEVYFTLIVTDNVLAIRSTKNQSF
jgi:hypothetical protein